MTDIPEPAPDRAFLLELPSGWAPEPDEEGGLVFARPDGTGLLHLVSFPQPPDEAPDPAEELFAFLAEQDVELQEDEIEDLELDEESEMSLCEYVAEDEDDEEEATYWLVAVATAPGNLVFASYSCPAGEEDEEREQVLAMLRSLRPTHNPEP